MISRADFRCRVDNEILVLDCGLGVLLQERGLHVGQINTLAVQIVRKAAKGRDVWIAGSIGPCGKYLKPVGSLDFKPVYQTFSEQVSSRLPVRICSSSKPCPTCVKPRLR